jgi:hypothetical protein
MRTKIVGKILMALIFASVIGGLSAGPALSDNDHRGQTAPGGYNPGNTPGGYDPRGGGPKQEGRHDNRRWQDDRRWHDDRGRYQYYRYQPETIYAPPPVYYAPAPSPGISIFFPPIHIR